MDFEAAVPNLGTTRPLDLTGVDGHGLKIEEKPLKTSHVYRKGHMPPLVSVMRLQGGFPHKVKLARFRTIVLKAYSH